MSNKLKSLLRAEVKVVEAKANEVGEAAKQIRFSANGCKTYFVYPEVKDGLLYESFFTERNGDIKLSAVTIFDKANEEMLTLKNEDKIRFSVAEFCSDVWMGANKVFVKPELKEVYDSYFQPTNAYGFSEACRLKRSDANLAKRKAKSEKLFANLQPLTDDMKAWAREDILGKHESLVYDAKTREGKCARCGGTMILPKSHTSHGTVGKCPMCGKEVTYRSKGRFACWYQYCAEVTFLQMFDNGNVIVRYFTANLMPRRDSDTRFMLVEAAREVINFETSEVELYKEHNGVWHKVNYKNYCQSYSYYGCGTPWFYTWGNSGYTYQGNLMEIIDATPLKYSCVEKYVDFADRYITSTFTTYVRKWLKCPKLEWIVKSGFDTVAREVLEDSFYIMAMRMKLDGKNLADVFHLNGQQWKAILPYAKEVSYKTIIMCASHPEQKVESIIEFARKFPFAGTSDLNTILDFGTIHKAIKYCAKDEFSLWMDYIRMSKEDGTFDKASSQIVFPRNIREAHQRQIDARRAMTLAERKKEHRKLLDAVTEMAAKVRNQFEFHQGKLLMTVPETGDQIVDEGNTQSICVGDFHQKYLRNMAEGLGFILFVRDENEPSKPFYTVEVRDGMIAQVRGKHNCAPTTEVQSFIKAFAEAKQLSCKY